MDESAHILDIYGSVLTKRCFYIETASDGIEGLQKLQEGSFDVVIIDVFLPKMDGIELAHQLQLAKINTRVVISTVNEDVENRANAIKYGVSAWFNRMNMDMGQFVQTISELAQGVSSRNTCQMFI